MKNLELDISHKGYDMMLWHSMNTSFSRFIKVRTKDTYHYKKVSIEYTARGKIRDLINSITQALVLEQKGRWRKALKRVRSEAKEYLYGAPDSLVFNNISQDEQQRLQKLCQQAWDFVTDEMGIDRELNNMLHYIYVSNHSNHARMWWKPKRSKDSKNRQYYYKVRVVPRDFWHTYERKTLGYKAECIPVSDDDGILFQLIHEFTHVAKHMKYGDSGGEIETTHNELKFARRNRPEYWENITEVQDMRKVKKTG